MHEPLDAATVRVLLDGDVTPLARLVAGLDVAAIVDVLDQLEQIPRYADDPDALFDLRLEIAYALDQQPGPSARFAEALMTIVFRGGDETKQEEFLAEFRPAIAAARARDFGPLATVFAEQPVEEVVGLMLAVDHHIEPWASDQAEAFRLVLELLDEYDARGDKAAAAHFGAALELYADLGARVNDHRGALARSRLGVRAERARRARADAETRKAVRSALRSCGYRAPRELRRGFRPSDLRWRLWSFGHRLARRGHPRRLRAGRGPRRTRAPGRRASAEDRPDDRVAVALLGEERRP